MSADEPNNMGGVKEQCTTRNALHNDVQVGENKGGHNGETCFLFQSLLAITSLLRQ